MGPGHFDLIFLFILFPLLGFPIGLHLTQIMKTSSMKLILVLGVAFSLGSLTHLSAEEAATPAEPATTVASAKPNPDEAKEARAKLNKTMQEAQKDPAVAAALKEAKKEQLKKALEIDPSLSEMIQKELARLDKVSEPKKPKDKKADTPAN